MKKNIEFIKKNKKILAIIIYNSYKEEGVKFLSPPDFPQQIAFISRKRGEVIDAHIHNLVKREIKETQESLFIKKGKLKVNFYDLRKKYLSSRILKAGDIILLAGGGHGFKVLNDVKMVEVKQGPYLGERDKIRFKGIEK